MEKNNREEVQIQTLRKAPAGGMKNKGRTFCRELKKGIHLAAVL